MKIDKIKEILQLGENHSIEFRSGCRDTAIIGQVVSGFLNATSGGYVVCGIDDTGKITGIDDAVATVKTLEQTLEKDLTPKTLVSIQVQKVQGKELIVIEVPAGNDQPYAFQDIIYLRDGQETRRADVGTIRDIILRRQIEPERWERRFSSADPDKDLDKTEIHSAITAIQKTERLQFRDSDNAIAVLEDLSVVKYGKLTNAGDVLFSANPAMRYPQIRVRAVRFTTDRADDKYRDMKSFEGPLVPLLEDVFRFIQRNTPTSADFTADDLKRRDEPVYPSPAIREGLVNAFAHRDYSDFSGGITISIYPNRVEIENTGRFPEGVTPDKLAIGHISVLRNPDIAHVLYLREFMEKIGRGSVLIQKSCTDRGLPLPRWSQNERGVTLTFFAPEVTQGVPGKYPGSTQGVPREYPGSTQGVTPEVMRLLKSFDGDMSRRDLQIILDLKDEDHFRSTYLKPAILQNLISLTVPDKPNSSKQKYRLTEKGQSLRDQK
ncbi:MAG: RNA-binding domain-containing protein [Methanoregula sp.]